MPLSSTVMTTCSPVAPRAEADLPAALGVLRRVGQQVHDDLLDPGRVGPERERPLLEVET